LLEYFLAQDNLPAILYIFNDMIFQEFCFKKLLHFAIADFFHSSPSFSLFTAAQIFAGSPGSPLNETLY